MLEDDGDGVPPWVWVAGFFTVVATAVGVGVWALRSPNWDRLLLDTGAPPEMIPFAAIQRYTESRGNPKAGLGRSEMFPTWAEPRNARREEQLAEANAALEAYDRNRDAYAESPYPERMWVFGSGGAYGLIPANALGPWRNSDALRRGKVTPYDIFNPWRSTVFFVDYVWRLIHRDEFEQLPPESRNWLAIKRGCASPSLMADFEETKTRSRTVRTRATEAAKALNIPEDVLYQRVPTSWPDYPGATELVP